MCLARLSRIQWGGSAMRACLGSFADSLFFRAWLFISLVTKFFTSCLWKGRVLFFMFCFYIIISALEDALKLIFNKMCERKATQC